jgi:hypothetical protein
MSETPIKGIISISAVKIAYRYETKIGAYQAVHDISKPLADLRGITPDNALVEVCQNILAAVGV